MTTENILISELLEKYQAHLRREERSENTVAKYVRDVKAYFSFLDGEPVSKENLLMWKKQLTEKMAPSSVNSMLAAVNGFLEWRGCPQMKAKPLRLQRDIFMKPEKELTKEEYIRLVQTAERMKRTRLSLLLQTICATGIRVSELKFITVEALKAARAPVDCKGKCRIVFLPAELCRSLRSYCRRQHIDTGAIFITKTGKPLDRSNIWRGMKELCDMAGVKPEKVFPHNLRHLFARTYYRLEKDLSRLADLLGHTDISTTRIYTMESGMEHQRQIDRLRLVLART